MMKVIQEWLTENGETPPKTTQKKKPSAKCIVVNKDNEVLILRRAEGAGFGKWDLPGGHIEEGEDAELAVKREVKEETRLQIDKPTKIKDLVIKYDNGDDSQEVKTKFFRARIEGPDDVYLNNSGNNKDMFYWQQTPRPEHSEYKWVKYRDELDRLPINSQIKELIAKELIDRYTDAGSDDAKDQEKAQKKQEKEKDKEKKDQKKAEVKKK